MHAPILVHRTPRGTITLRPLRDDDLDAVVELGNDPLVQRWTNLPSPYRPGHGRAWLAGRAEQWEHGTEGALAIDVDEAGTDRQADRGGATPDRTPKPRFAGYVTLRFTGGGGAEIGYVLASWARGRGIMASAVRRLLGWAFAETDDGGAGLDVVHWQAPVGHWASRRVAWACGFRIEGSVRGLRLHRGQRQDAWIGSIVRGTEFAPVHAWLDAATITGRCVVLRAWRDDDAPRVAQACTDPESQRWLRHLPNPYTITDARDYIASVMEAQANASGVHWCVADPRQDQCLGSIALMGLSGPTPAREIGYWAHPDARGRGVMSEAARLVVRHALIDVADGGLGLPRVSLRADVANIASNRVAVRAGLTQYGVAHGLEPAQDGSPADFALYEAHAIQPR